MKPVTGGASSGELLRPLPHPPLVMKPVTGGASSGELLRPLPYPPLVVSHVATVPPSDVHNCTPFSAPLSSPTRTHLNPVCYSPGPSTLCATALAPQPCVLQPWPLNNHTT